MGRIEPAFAGPMHADREVLQGLRLAGMRGKVAVMLDESSLFVETRRGHATGFPLSTVAGHNHHQTHLMPPLSQYIGAILLVCGLWLIELPAVRRLVLFAGLAILASWLLTRRPTLTVELTNGETYVITGPDSILMRLSFMLNRVMDGISLDEARAGLEHLDTTRPHPITSTPAALITPAPIAGLLQGESPARPSAEGLLEEFIHDEESARIDPHPTMVVNFNSAPASGPAPESFLPAPVSTGLIHRATDALEQHRLGEPEQAPLHPRSPVDHDEATRQLAAAGPTFGIAATGWQEPMQEQPLVQDSGFLPSFIGQNGAVAPPRPLDAEPFGMDAALEQALEAELVDEQPFEREQAPAAMEGVVRRAMDHTLAASPRHVSSMPRRDVNKAPVGLQRTRIPRIPRRRLTLSNLFTAAGSQSPPSPSESDYARTYGDPDATLNPEADVPEMDEFMRARLRADSASQGILREDQQRLAGSTGGERPNDRYTELMDSMSAPLPASEETLTGERQAQLGPSLRFGDLTEVGQEQARSTPFLDLDRLDD